MSDFFDIFKSLVTVLLLLANVIDIVMNYRYKLYLEMLIGLVH